MSRCVLICFGYVWRFDGLIVRRVRRDVLRIEDFEGGILVAVDSLCLSVFHSLEIIHQTPF